MEKLFCDCKTDAEKSAFFLSGRAVETGVIAPAISNDVAMAYHRCAQLKKENDTLRDKIEVMEKQEPVAWGAFYFGGKLNGKLYSQCDTEAQIDMYIADRHQSDDSNTFRKAPIYTLPGAKGEEK